MMRLMLSRIGATRSYERGTSDKAQAIGTQTLFTERAEADQATAHDDEVA